MTDAHPQSVFDFSASCMDGSEVSLAQYRGNVLLIVNTASKCGYTPQYTGLESLYRQFKDRGLVVLGFPCNQFGAQEPGSNAEIARFCERNYGVTFPLFAKIDVNGSNAHPLFQFLRREQPGFLGFLGLNSIQWNFTKFLVDHAGKAVARFSPATSPAKLGAQIDQLL